MALFVPPQLRNANGSWFTLVYNFLVELVVAINAMMSGGASSSLVYQPGGTASPGVYVDPWALFAAIPQDVPCDVYVDCTYVGVAPWPVDQNIPNVTFRQANVPAPAVLSLVTGTNPSTGNPTNGQLLYPVALDDVGVQNDPSTPTGAAALVTVGGAFSAVFSLQNGAYLQRQDDADALALQINEPSSNYPFLLKVENCPTPFPNLASAVTSNLVFTGSNGQLNVELTDGGPDFAMVPCTCTDATTALSVTYDGTIPPLQVLASYLATHWAGAITTTGLAQVPRGAWFSQSCTATTTTQQYLTPGYSLSTVVNAGESTGQLPAVTQALPGSISRFSVNFTGGTSNSGYVTFVLYRNGVRVTGASLSVVTDVATPTSVTQDFAPVQIVPGDTLALALTLEENLATPLTNIGASVC